MFVVLRRGAALVTPAPEAACVAVMVELKKSTATAAIEMFKVRMKFLPIIGPPRAKADQRKMELTFSFVCSAKARPIIVLAVSALALGLKGPRKR